MTKTFSIRPEFVDEIPESLDEGVLYISLPYGWPHTHVAAAAKQESTLPYCPPDGT